MGVKCYEELTDKKIVQQILSEIEEKKQEAEKISKEKKFRKGKS